MDNQNALQRNTVISLPQRAQTYLVFRGLLGAAILMVLGFVVSHLPPGVCHGGPCPIGPRMTSLIFYVVGVGVGILGYYFAQSFALKLTDTNITIHSGVLFRDSMMINFDKVQDVDVFRGPFHMAFNVSVVRIWTASQGQIVGGRKPKPAGALVLGRDQADWLQEFIQQAPKR
jgi:uncharacterized membrane protein YdbT with pleckstrin-like domain